MPIGDIKTTAQTGLVSYQYPSQSFSRSRKISGHSNPQLLT